MPVINTNIKSLISQNALGINSRSLATAMQQLSTGKRINSAADDAAGLAISTRMTVQIHGLTQAVRNANDGISLAQTAEGSLVEVTNMLQRMRELAVQSANDTNSDDDRKYLDLEFQQLKTEINRIGSATEWNGMRLLDGSGAENGRFRFQVGSRKDQVIELRIPNFSTTPGTAPTSSASIVKNLIAAGQAAQAAQVVQSSGTYQVASTPGVSAQTSTTTSTGELFKTTVQQPQPATSTSLGRPQESVLTISGTRYAAGDTITISLDNTRQITYVVANTDVVSGNAAQTANNIADKIVAQASVDKTLGLTVQRTGNSGEIKLSGANGVTFTPTVTSTIASAGSISSSVTQGPVDPLTREIDKLAFSGSFAAGDVITLTVTNPDSTTSQYTHTVTQAANATSGYTALATAIATNIKGKLGDTIVDVDANGALLFTAQTAGTAGDFSVSTAVSPSSASTVSVQTPQTAVADIPGSPAVPEKSEVLFTAPFFAGDIIKLQVQGKSVQYQVTATDVSSANPVANILAGVQVAAAGLGVSPTPTIPDPNGNRLLFTGSADGSALGLNLLPVSRNPASVTTPAAPESTQYTLSGGFNAGDVLAFSYGGQNISYTVSTNDSAATDPLNAILNGLKANMNIAGVTTAVTGSTLTITGLGDGSSGNFTAANPLRVSVTQPAVAAQPEVSELTLSGSFSVGDVINVSAYGANVGYTVTDQDLAASNPLKTITQNVVNAVNQAGINGLTTSQIGDNNIRFTGQADGTPINLYPALAPILPPGTTAGGALQMIHNDDILTRATSNDTLSNLDASMDVINEARATLGAVINRLTYAGDNLNNVIINTSESRSRVLDTDYAKASSELSRTQIIQQAATAVLAQANTDQQTVLKLLQG